MRLPRRIGSTRAGTLKISKPLVGKYRMPPMARSVFWGAGALPARWHGAGERPSDAEQKRRNAVAMLAPTQCLAPQTLQSLQTDLNEVGSALAEARALMDFSEGRFPVAWASDGVSTQLRHLTKARCRQPAGL